MSVEPIRKGGRLVVIGGVAAGMSAASQAKRRRPDIEVIALEKSGFVSYGACGMPYNIADPQRQIDDLVVITPERFKNERGIEVRLYHEAVKIDRENRRVLVRPKDGNEYWLEYDRLVIATGARAVVPPVKGVDARGVFVLRTLDDGGALKRYIDQLDNNKGKAVIVGGGYIGMEMAEVLTHRGFSVVVVEKLPHILPGIAESVRKWVEEELSRNGVEVITGNGLSGFEQDENGNLTAVNLEDGTRIETNLALVAIGVKPNSEIAAEAGLKLGARNAIAVNDYMQTSDPLIFAAGDCAEASFKLGGNPVWIPLGTTANKQGRIAGANVVGAGEKFQGVLGTSIFKVFDLEVARTGVEIEEASRLGFEPMANEITARTRAHAYPGAKKILLRLVFDKPTGRLLGAQLAAGEGGKKIDVLATAIDAGFDLNRLYGLDLAYAPPFAPVWDPILVAATQAEKKRQKAIKEGG